MNRIGCKWVCGLAAVVLLSGTTAWANSPPVVSNVVANQRTDGSKLVDIYYDLADADADACTVTVVASSDNGITWTVPITAVSGDVGPGIAPGVGRHIVWNCALDLPGAFGSYYKTRVCADDGHAPAGMMLVPAGEYSMGDHHDGMAEALPLHTVSIDTFRMDRYEVTNEQYAAGLNWAFAQGGQITVTNNVVYKAGGGTTYPYCDTTASSSYSRITWNGSTFGVVTGKENHPMVMVSWYGSVAYANWRSVMEGRQTCYDTSTWACNFSANGYRLPTEAEWEKAARGGLYSPYRRYPWGDTLNGSQANYYGSGDPYEAGADPDTTPVGYYNGGQTPPGLDMANGYGLYDMAGNVWEWCNDWYSSTYYSSSPYDNPHGPASGTSRVLRGGSWSDGGNGLRCAYRISSAPDDRYSNYGFRLALDSD